MSLIPRLGIISALHEEQAGLIDHMTSSRQTVHGLRNYVTGNLWGTECVCVLSRIGKVASATTALMLIERFSVSHILFTGVAGSGDADVRIGDVVIADQCVQHDVDASPLFPRFEVPLTGKTHFPTDTAFSDGIRSATQNFLDQDWKHVIGAAECEKFRLKQPKAHTGLIASGDQFLNSRVKMDELKRMLPAMMAVEMEGAAVAQVCDDFQVPYAVIRTISDTADEAAPVDFMAFVDRVAARYAYGIIKRFCESVRRPD